MLKDKNNDLLHLLSVIESIEKIKAYSHALETAEDFFEYNEQLNFNATLTLLMNSDSLRLNSILQHSKFLPASVLS